MYKAGLILRNKSCRFHTAWHMLVSSCSLRLSEIESSLLFVRNSREGDGGWCKYEMGYESRKRS